MNGREYLMRFVIEPIFILMIGIGIVLAERSCNDDKADEAPKVSKVKHKKAVDEVPNELLPIYATAKTNYQPEPEQRVIETPVHTPEPSKEAQAMPTVANDVQAFQAAVNDERNRRQAIDAEQNTKQAVAPVAKPKLDSNIIPTVTLGNPEITGNLSKNSIQKVVKQNIAKVRKCYENELAINHELKGKLTIQWLIDEGGYVDRIGLLETTFNNNHIENCIEDAIEYWRFPAPKGGESVHVAYPFEFETKLKTSSKKKTPK